MVVDYGGVPAIQRLAQAPEVRSLQSKDLGQRALKRLAEDPASRVKLNPEALDSADAYNALPHIHPTPVVISSGLLPGVADTAQQHLRLEAHIPC